MIKCSYRRLWMLLNSTFGVTMYSFHGLEHHLLFMSVLWKDCTTREPVSGGVVGLVSSVGLTIVSASVAEAVLRWAAPCSRLHAVLDERRFPDHLSGVQDG